MIKKAVIVAAGLSSRLYPLTLEKPKSLLPVNDKEILTRSMQILNANGINEIGIVVGYKKEMIKELLKNKATFISNPFYEQCNNMGSLWFARDFVGVEPFLYLHGDLIYHEQILESSLNHFIYHQNDLELVTEFGKTDEEAMKVRVDASFYLLESNKEIKLEEAHGEWIGMAYVRKPLVLFKYVEETLFTAGLNLYDTFAFTKMAVDGYKVFCSSTEKLPWVEIDYLDDYNKAKEIFL
jgi:choline kinase